MPLINLNSDSTTIPDDIARDTEVAAAIAAHNTADWVHLDYLYRIFVARDRSTQSPQTYITDTEVTSAIANHTAAVDPHPIYLTQVEGDGRYRRSAVVTGNLPTLAGGFVDIPLPLDITSSNIIGITGIASVNIGNTIRNVPPQSFPVPGVAVWYWYNLYAVSGFPVGTSPVSARLNVGTETESQSIFGASVRVFVNY